jgi:menaquinone-specific isochorismate synthase
MSVAVTALPSYSTIWDSERELYRFLLATQSKLRGQQTVILSLSQRLEPVDFLQVLATISPLRTIHFYQESRDCQEALLGFGVCCQLTLQDSLTGGDRFAQAKQFVESCFHLIHPLPSTSSAGIVPTIYCGFSFFDQTDPQAAFPPAFVFLPHFQLIKRDYHYHLLCNFLIDKTRNLKFLVKQTFRQLQRIKQIQGHWPHRETFLPHHSQPQSVNPHLSEAIQSLLPAIQSQELHKVVLAQALDLVLPSSFGLADSLQRLRSHYPDCAVFSLGNGQGDYFIGASPERLLSIQQQQFLTDALAGSAPRGKTPQEDARLAHQLLQSEKERYEHQVVIEFLINRLTSLGLTPQRSPLKLLKLSNIQHLWTPIHAQLLPHLHPLEIIAQLHPTPAVAGVPTAKACELIQRHENFDRSLYAAPLGWIDYQGNSEFRVGIRSALIRQNQARLFAGAGIVLGSDPQQELAEIHLKLQTLLRALL